LPPSVCVDFLRQVDSDIYIGMPFNDAMKALRKKAKAQVLA